MPRIDGSVEQMNKALEQETDRTDPDVSGWVFGNEREPIEVQTRKKIFKYAGGRGVELSPDDLF